MVESSWGHGGRILKERLGECQCLNEGVGLPFLTLRFPLQGEGEVQGLQMGGTNPADFH